MRGNSMRFGPLRRLADRDSVIVAAEARVLQLKCRSGRAFLVSGNPASIFAG